MQEPSGVFIDGEWRDSPERLTVFDKFTLAPAAELSMADEGQVAMAVAGAQRAGDNPLPPAERHDILNRAADLLVERTDIIVDSYVTETGFVPADGRTEVMRSAQTFRLSAGEAIRIAGEEVPVAGTAGSEDRLAFTMRIPVGVVVAIAPFNAPLSTVAHKIGPALAAGNGVVLKPAAATPLSSIALTQALTDAGLPSGYLQLLTGRGSTTGTALVGDDRVRFITFTGSTAVGRAIAQKSGLARTHLELGANSVSIVAQDADLELVTKLTTKGGFRKAGQVCTSVQRILAHRSRAKELGELLGEKVARMHAGDPRDPGSDIGPLISVSDAERAHDWISAATTANTRVVGGDLDGSLLQPTVVLDPDPASSLFNDEVFAPIVNVTEIDSMEKGIEMVNAGQYGLQTGVFTQDIDRAFDAAKRLKVGGVMINDTSSYHADTMPYGGVKASGHGSEGPNYAVEDMTDRRIVVLNLRPGSENGE